MPYNPNAYRSSRVGGAAAASAASLPGPVNPFDSSRQQFQQLLPWLGTVSGANTISVPAQPGIPSESLDQTPPNADDTSRRVEVTEDKGVVVSTKTSNLVSCPNAEGEVGLGCWLLSSDNDRFARKNLEQDTMPGEKEPRDIMVVPGNFFELQNDFASQSYTNVTADLYNQESLASEQRIFTGVMVNSNTGQMYETYEDDVPPPNTDKARHEEVEFTVQNPKLTALNGGWDPNLPTRNKTEILEIEHGPDAGLNPWGSVLYASAIRDITEQRDVRQQFNNRDGFVPIEPAWDRRAVGFVGHVSAYRGTPHMPPTQREGRNKAVTFDQTVTNVDNPDFDRPADRTNPVNEERSTGNREHPSMFQNASMASVNYAPGRINYSAVELHQTAGKTNPNITFDPTINAGQIYVDGHITLKDEARYSNYVAGSDAHAVKTVSLARGIVRGATKQDKATPSRWTGSTVDSGENFMASVRLVTDRSLGSNAAASAAALVSSIATVGSGDGRPADESAFMASVRLVTDARQAQIRGFDSFENGHNSSRVDAQTKLAPENPRDARLMGHEMDGGAYVKTMPEYTGSLIDRSRRASVGSGSIGTLESENTLMRAENRSAKSDSVQLYRLQPTYGQVSGASPERLDQTNTVYRRHFGEALPRIQPSFVATW